MSDDIKKGLLGIVVDETTISQVMPDINSLTYRGYAVQDLCEKCSFEEVAYLILNKELPNKAKLKKFKKELEENRNITINLREIVKHMPKKSHPMDVVRTVVSVMGLEDKDTSNNSPAANMKKAIRIFSKTPTAIAIPPNRKSCSLDEKLKSFKILISVKGEIGTKTPITLAMLLAPRLYAPKAPANKRAALVYASNRRICNFAFCRKFFVITKKSIESKPAIIGHKTQVPKIVIKT